MKPGRLPAAAAALTAIGLVFGTILDDAPERPPVFRAGYRVLEADFHSHTRFSDGVLSPIDLVLQARRRGLDALAITEHNATFPAEIGRAFSRLVGGPTILVGEEITTNRYHVIGVGLTKRIDASLPLSQVIDRIHAQNGIVIAAHPVSRFWPSLVPARPLFDAAEVVHPLFFQSPRGGWKWTEMRDYYEASIAEGHRLTAIGSSDYHFGSPLGVVRTLVFARGDGAAAVLDALREGRTVVFDPDGHGYGDPALLEALAHEPYTPRTSDYGYRGSGLLDRLTRAAALFGLLGLLLFGGARRKTPGVVG